MVGATMTTEFEFAVDAFGTGPEFCVLEEWLIQQLTKELEKMKENFEAMKQNMKDAYFDLAEKNKEERSNRGQYEELYRQEIERREKIEELYEKEKEKSQGDQPDTLSSNDVSRIRGVLERLKTRCPLTENNISTQ